MTRARPLPEPLGQRPFTVSDARGLGVSVSRLRASDLEMPTRGVRVSRSPPRDVAAHESPSDRMQRLREELIRRAEEIAPALTSDQFFSHSTGLALLGVPLPYTTARRHDVHVSARRPAGQPRRAGVVGHRLQRREAAVGRVRSLPVEHPARLWRQVGATWALDDLIAAGDHLIHPRRPLATLNALQREVDEVGDLAGGVLRRALAAVRPGAETPEETRLRLAIVRAGLPEPELNIDLRTPGGRFVARLDLAYPAYRTAVEHDGRIHAFDSGQFARDADRWDDIRSVGWQHVRVLSHHLHPDPRPAVAKVTDALLRAGWRPGR